MRDEEVPQEWMEAFDQMIVTARKLRPKGATREATEEYAAAIGGIGARAGLTEDETVSYGLRVWAMVLGEHHA